MGEKKRGEEKGAAVYSFMTGINEESRYTAPGESRQLRRNERDVLIVPG